MGSVEPNPERVQELLDGADDAPIVMINLLRYRSRAVYPEDSPPSRVRDERRTGATGPP